jgi:hypothetical protein
VPCTAFVCNAFADCQKYARMPVHKHRHTPVTSTLYLECGPVVKGPLVRLLANHDGGDLELVVAASGVLRGVRVCVCARMCACACVCVCY